MSPIQWGFRPKVFRKPILSLSRRNLRWLGRPVAALLGARVRRPRQVAAEEDSGRAVTLRLFSHPNCLDQRASLEDR